MTDNETPKSDARRPRGSSESAEGQPASAQIADAMGAPPTIDGGADTTTDPGSLEALLEERQAQYLRLAADFENHRRRSARDLVERSRFAALEASLALLPVLDNLRRAVDAAPEDTAPALLDGLRYTVRQFEAALESVGVTPIEAVGVPFDPAVHEAVMGDEAADVAVDTAVEELQRGWRLHDRVLRPAMVRVAHPLAGTQAPPPAARTAPPQGFEDV